jgi:hypothetical protein
MEGMRAGHTLQSANGHAADLDTDGSSADQDE